MTESVTTDLPIRFDEYEVSGVMEYEDATGKFCEVVEDAEAKFWSLYGHIPGEGVICIGDFSTREFAEEIYARITGRKYGTLANRYGGNHVQINR